MQPTYNTCAMQVRIQVRTCTYSHIQQLLLSKRFWHEGWACLTSIFSLPFPSLPFPSLPFPSLPFPSLPFPSLPFPSLPFPSLPFPSLPFPSLPFPSLPFPSLPFPSLPFPSLPFPSLPFPSLEGHCKYVVALVGGWAARLLFLSQVSRLFIGTARP